MSPKKWRKTVVFTSFPSFSPYPLDDTIILVSGLFFSLIKYTFQTLSEGVEFSSTTAIEISSTIFSGRSFFIPLYFFDLLVLAFFVVFLAVAVLAAALALPFGSASAHFSTSS